MATMKETFPTGVSAHRDSLSRIRRRTSLGSLRLSVGPNALGLTQSLLKHLEKLHDSRSENTELLIKPSNETANNNNNNNNNSNNINNNTTTDNDVDPDNHNNHAHNFLLQFALRRQSHVSLNRLFGGLGESAVRRGLQEGVKAGPTKPLHPLSEVESEPSHSSRSLPPSVRGNFSLVRLASEKRARRVRFYRNGDRFFQGMVYAVSTERFRTFESLLTSLTSSPLCDSKQMPNGVRHIFSADGSRRVSSLDQLEEGESYVCASTDVFRSLDYCKNEDPAWNQHLFPVHTPVQAQKSQSQSVQHKDDKKESQSRIHSATSLARPTSTSGMNRAQNNHSRGSSTTPRSVSAVGSQSEPAGGKSPRDPTTGMSPEEKRAYEEFQRSFVTPCLITVIRNGKRPRKAVRLLLNKKTAISFEQVMADINDAIKIDVGGVKKLFTLSGQQVACLADFFQGDTVFIATNHSKLSPYDYDLDENEIRQVNAYRPFTRRVRERITLRKSPHSSTSKCSDEPPTSAPSSRSEKVGVRLPVDPSEVSDKSSREKDGELHLPLTLANKYQVGKTIGTGNFAVVMECKDKKTKRKYALKIINKENCKGKEKMIDNEVRILRCVKHPNIVRLVEDYISQHQIFYVMELVKGGDLFDAIANTSSKYTEQDASGMLYNLASALEYLHSLRIVHRDVKPENILIRQHEDSTKSLKLGDFGLATEVNGPQFVVCGTPTYVAPEVLAETGYGLKIDVWSAGVIAYILLCGFPPFSSPSENQDELFEMIMKGTFEFPSPYWDEISASAKAVISGMLEMDAEKRLSASQVLDHKWVATDTHYENDLRRNVSIGLSTYFRRGPKSPRSRNRGGMKVLTTTALDKSSRYFKGRGNRPVSVRSKGQE